MIKSMKKRKKKKDYLLKRSFRAKSISGRLKNNIV